MKKFQSGDQLKEENGNHSLNHKLEIITCGILVLSIR
jgi:hypothetical protein